MSTTPKDFNTQVIEEFRANGGKAGGMFEGMPLVLVHNVGAKSGKEYVTPLVYLADGDDYRHLRLQRRAPRKTRAGTTT